MVTAVEAITNQAAFRLSFVVRFVRDTTGGLAIVS
jgi:hypothetical protein